MGASDTPRLDQDQWPRDQSTVTHKGVALWQKRGFPRDDSRPHIHGIDGIACVSQKAGGLWEPRTKTAGVLTILEKTDQMKGVIQWQTSLYSVSWVLAGIQQSFDSPVVSSFSAA